MTDPQALKEILAEKYKRAHGLRELLEEEQCESFHELVEKFKRGGAIAPEPYSYRDPQHDPRVRMKAAGFNIELIDKAANYGLRGYRLDNMPDKERSMYQLRDYLNNWYQNPSRMRIVVFYGDTGRGKTDLATRLTYQILKKQPTWRARYIRDRSFRDDEQRWHKNPRSDIYGPADELKYNTPKILVLDEFGDRPTGWGFGFWLDVLDFLADKPLLLIVCSNLRPGGENDAKAGTLFHTEKHIDGGTGASPVSSRIGNKNNLQLGLVGKDWRA